MDKTNQKNALSLANATAYSISLVTDSCASGLNATATEANGALRVFKFDTGCQVTLDSFSVNGFDYLPQAGNEFSTYLVGETAIYEDSGAGVTIQVSIAATLQSPVQVGDTIVFNFVELIEGADENVANSVVSDDHSITVGGATAPNFTIAAVRFVGMTGTGAGEFEFDLECGAALVGVDSTGDCDGVVLNTISYALVEDSYASVLTAAEAAAILAASSETIADGEVIAAGGTLVNGGFSSKAAASGSVLTGPDGIAGKPNMILLLGAGGSYKYFNVDVDAIVQP